MAAPRWALAALLAWPLAAPGVDRLELSAASLEGGDWRASGIRMVLPLREAPGELSIAELRLPEPLGVQRDVRARCGRLDLAGEELRCRDGRFRLQGNLVGAEEFRGDLRLDRRHGRLRLDLRDLPVAGGRLALQADLSASRSEVRLAGRDLELEGLLALAARLGVRPPPLEGGGRLGLEAKLVRQDGGDRAEFRVELAALSLADASGRLATDGLRATLSGNARRLAGATAFDLTLSTDSGQAYVDPVFLDAGQYPLTLGLRGRLEPPWLTLDHFRLRQPGVADAEGRLRLDAASGRIDDLTLRLHQADFAGAYGLYASPFLIGTALDSLQGAGRLSGRLELVDGAPAALQLALEGLDVADQDGRFGVGGLGGSLHWSADHGVATPASELRWRTGHFRGIEIGAVSLPLRLRAGDLELLAPVRLPVLNGALAINQLKIERARQADMTLLFDAALEPIDLQRLTAAFGWPEFAGSLSGRLPSLVYRDGRLRLGGRLEVAAFNGEIGLDNLSLADPFGRLPRLATDVRLRNLDLKALTDTFAFGRIEGRLDGDIEQLRLVNWQPAAFNARFYTSPGDRSRHRISQRAVQNISSIGGGGAGAVLSRGFLSVFEDFSYDRIGLSCQLREDVCFMDGLAPSKDGRGYYIVRGRWLPRIDVIGYQREVSWSTLVEQLKSVTESEGPIVQ